MGRIEAALQRAQVLRDGRAPGDFGSGLPPDTSPARSWDTGSGPTGNRPVVQAADPDAADLHGLGRASDDASSRLVVAPHIEPVSVEQYRKLAATLHRIQDTRDFNVVMVSSAVPGEGKTLTSANLALTLSESYRRHVLLIDADMRRPSIQTLFDLPEGPGLADTLRSTATPKLPVIPVTPWLSVAQAGSPEHDPMSLLTSPSMAQVVEDAAARYDWVILDTPPVGLLPDAHLLSAMVDGALLVIAAGRTPYAAVQQAIAALGRERIVGTVLNGVAASKINPGTDSASYARYYATLSPGRGHGRAR